jgi:cytochrome P450
MPRNGTFNVLTAWDKTIHGRKRRVIGQGFTESAVRGYESTIKENIDIFCGRLLSADGAYSPEPNDSELWSTPLDMASFGLQKCASTDDMSLTPSSELSLVRHHDRCGL